MRILKRLLVALLSTLVGLAAFEGLLRAFEAPSTDAEIRVWPPHLAVEFEVTDGVMPGVSAPTRFTTNERGMRGEPWDTPADQRILAIGGSTTECLYLDDTDAWPAVLQRRLNTPGSAQRFWVGNVGKSGRTADQHVLDVDELAPQLDNLDVVLVLVGVNDLHRRLMFGDRPFAPKDIRVPMLRDTVRAASFAKPPTPRARAHLRIVDLWHRLQTQAPTTTDAEGIVTQDRNGEVFARLREARQTRTKTRDLPDLTTARRYYAACLQAIVDSAAQQQLRLIFLSQPSMWRDDLSESEQDLLWMGGVGDLFASKTREYHSVAALAEGMRIFNDTLREVCQTRSVELIDLAEQLPKSTAVFYDDVHFNEAGAAAVADQVAAYLRAHPNRSSAPPVHRPDRPFAATDNLIHIERFGPRTAQTGSPFNEQKDGSSALWLQTDRPLSAFEYIRIGETILPTSRHPTGANATVPAALSARWTREPTTLPLSIVNVDRRETMTFGELRVTAPKK